MVRSLNSSHHLHTSIQRAALTHPYAVHSYGNNNKSDKKISGKIIKQPVALPVIRNAIAQLEKKAEFDNDGDDELVDAEEENDNDSSFSESDDIGFKSCYSQTTINEIEKLRSVSLKSVKCIPESKSIHVKKTTEWTNLHNLINNVKPTSEKNKKPTQVAAFT